MSDTNLIEKVKARFGDSVLDDHNFRGDQTVTVKRDIGLDFFPIFKGRPGSGFQVPDGPDGGRLFEKKIGPIRGCLPFLFC